MNELRVGTRIAELRSINNITQLELAEKLGVTDRAVSKWERAEASPDTDNLIELMEAFVAEARASLNRTPELLPVLKEVGVVDSGGQGLLFIYEGFLASLKGEALPEKNDASLDDLINAFELFLARQKLNKPLNTKITNV